MVAAISEFSMVGESGAAIASALRTRDAEQAGRLVQQYHYRLLRYLVYLTGRREAAEDLVQETWMRALERAGQYDGRSRFEPWLFAIARNLAIDWLRREGRGALAESGDAPEPAAGDAASPFAAAARSEDAVRVAAALGGLPAAQREALLLRFQEELSLEEIAAVTGAPVSTVSSRIQRGLAALRARFEGGVHA
jgi:RNA polymerase sigma-70 factor (ECF subfamily)